MLGVKLRVTVLWAVSSVQASVAQPGPRGQTCQQGQAVRVCPCKSVLCIRAHRLKRVVDVIPCPQEVSLACVSLPTQYIRSHIRSSANASFSVYTNHLGPLEQSPWGLVTQATDKYLPAVLGIEPLTTRALACPV